ncbi:agamous-like MADS-box protein AGL61 [Glycine soja]|uniref:Agamous-like MADS-box protein AGL61 n=1 Tax=Glycine soja TaxID=3848 RepID=A0A0B2NWY0_GLYSO|nr:agamous-like MADS-box protein AGL61 [Glycine soja]KHN01565.1 Agamous-like MADS-box protein AGL61 [Glycine soja]RZB43793.1 Agamous-like MADS-box protein AGL61 [Glycine soja]
MDMFKQKEKKKNTGRKKIEIKKLDKGSNKQVTFSKRRTGLFKKASELCILCNVYVAIIVFSPADKLFCFGHPDIDSIIGRYLKGDNAEFESAKSSKEKSVSCEERNRQYEEAMKKLELEKKNLAQIEVLTKGWNRSWWDDPIDQMTDLQLEQFMVSIYELRKKLAERAGELMM